MFGKGMDEEARCINDRVRFEGGAQTAETGVIQIYLSSAGV